jgi:hypothetical protein
MDANMNSSNKILDKAINGVLGHTTKHNIGVITAHRDEYTASESRQEVWTRYCHVQSTR